MTSRNQKVNPTSERAFGQGEARGIKEKKAREDHSHGTPANPVNTHESSPNAHPIYLTQAEADVLYALIAAGVTNGDSHDHSGGDGAQIDHVGLANKGSNSHSAIDSHISGVGAAVHGLGTMSVKDVGATAGPFTVITSITVVDGVVTALTGS